MYLGAVGAYDWSGTVVKYDNANDPTPDIPGFEEVRRVLPDRTKISYLGEQIEHVRQHDKSRLFSVRAKKILSRKNN